jgi:hypothetical protein
MTMTNKDEEIEETEDTQEQDLEKELEKEEKEEDEGDDDEDSVDFWKKKAATAEAQKDHWRKKAQGATDTKKDTEASKDSLSSLDILALSRSNVHDDDIEEVVEYAKFKKISVAEALKSNTVKAVIAEKSEYRKTAEVTTTGAAKKTTSKVSDQALAENLSKGVVPEKGSEEADRLFWARRGGKR